MGVKTCRGHRIHVRMDMDGKYSWFAENKPTGLVSPYFFDTPDEAFKDARETIKTFLTKEKKLDLDKVQRKYRRKK